MKEEAAFIVLPYVAAASFVLVPPLRLAWNAHLVTTASPVYADLRRSCAGGRLLGWGLLGLLAAHLLGLLMPARVLFWNRIPARLFLLELSGLALGLLAVAGYLLLLRRRRGRAPLPTADLVASTLLAAVLLGGLAVAVTYRWGSNLYTVALVPYLRSLAAGAPRLELMAQMPPLVRFHVLVSFAWLAVLPFTRWVYLAAPLFEGGRRAAAGLRARLGRKLHLRATD